MTLISLLKVALALPFFSAAFAVKAQKPDPIVRKKLLMASFSSRQVANADMREITFKPLQQTGRHLHNVPVVGYIVSGTVRFQVEGQPALTLHAGDAFYEPANTPIAHFDNLSPKNGLKFIACYLLDHPDRNLIRLLPEQARH